MEKKGSNKKPSSIKKKILTVFFLSLFLVTVTFIIVIIGLNTLTSSAFKAGSKEESSRIGELSYTVLPLKSSKRMLLLHLTDSSAAKMRYADQDCRKLESWGTLPYLAARGEAEISLKPESGEFQLYAVDSAGKRLGEIPLNKQADGSLKAVLRVFQPFGQVFAYELRKKNILSTNNSQHF